jgi:hypothetical protein
MRASGVACANLPNRLHLPQLSDLHSRLASRIAHCLGEIAGIGFEGVEVVHHPEALTKPASRNRYAHVSYNT